ncbi:MAG: hypothetical protein AAF678_10030 [Pseudomonadota bacterium]
MQDDVTLQSNASAPRWAGFSTLEQRLKARPRLTRWILCGPVALIVTLLVMMGMAHWWPGGAAQIDNIAMPVVLFPLIWAGIFFYALADDKLARAALVMTILMVANVVLLLLSI